MADVSASFVAFFKSSTGHIFMYNVTDAVWVILFELIMNSKRYDCSYNKINSLSWIHYVMEDYKIFGHPIGNQVIWVGLSMKRSIKNVLKFREPLVMKVNAEGYPYPCIDTKSCIFFITINRFQCKRYCYHKDHIILSNQLNFQTP